MAAGVLLLLATFVLGVAVQRGLTAELDAALMLAMAGGPIGFWRFWTGIGDSGTRLAIAAVALVALAGARHWRHAALLLATVAGGMALNSMAKLTASRPRPSLLPHLDDVATFSFPSGHAANSMVLALALALLVPERRRGVAIAMALAVAGLIGLSRVALAVHWPSDVLAGWCEGAGFVLLVQAAARRKVATR